MTWLDGIAQTHDVFVHLPLAVAVLLPLPLIAAQRAGRGIKPWWITCRYLAWAGVIGSLPTALSGYRMAQDTHLVSGVLKLARGTSSLFQWHPWLGLGTLVVGALMLKALHRKRSDHQGIGVLGLFLGLLWSAAILVGGYQGHARQRPVPAAPVGTSQQVPAEPATQTDLEKDAPAKALDYASLIPMHTEPVRSIPHGNRWIRVWANAKAAASYREGRALPDGSLVVMSTVEDRWGRPGYEPGPVYALEVKAGQKPFLTFYWPNVPAGRRQETGGQERAYWRGQDAGLQSCMSCHASGMAAPIDRSRVRIPKPRKTETDDR